MISRGATAKSASGRKQDLHRATTRCEINTVATAGEPAFRSAEQYCRSATRCSSMRTVSITIINEGNTIQEESVMSVTRKRAGRKIVSSAVTFSVVAFIALAGKQSLAASAPDYPAKAVTFFALSGPGSGFDTTTRAVANALVKE